MHKINFLKEGTIHTVFLDYYEAEKNTYFYDKPYYYQVMAQTTFNVALFLIFILG